MKTGPYNPIKKGLTKYESYRLITLQEHDPPLDADLMRECLGRVEIELRQIDYLVTSKLKRAKETAQYLIDHNLVRGNIGLKSMSCLNEIKFDMAVLCSEEEYEKQGSTIVRQRFISAFIGDTLTETRDEIKKRFNDFEKELLKLKSHYQNILCLSHTFFIKLYTNYKIHRELFVKPVILKNHLHPEKRLMEFCSRSRVNWG